MINQLLDFSVLNEALTEAELKAVEVERKRKEEIEKKNNIPSFNFKNLETFNLTYDANLSLHEIEKQAIVLALFYTKSKTNAASRLQISLTTLYNKMKTHDLVQDFNKYIGRPEFWYE